MINGVPQSNSKHYTHPCKFGTTSSAPAMLWEPPITATVSWVVKPSSPKRWRMDWTLSKGSGTNRLGAAALGGARPIRKGMRGAPGHCTRLTAPASWMLWTKLFSRMVRYVKNKCSQVSRSEYIGVLEQEWTKGVENVVDSSVSMERQLGCVEGSNGSISSSTTVVAYYQILGNIKLRQIHTPKLER